jgi:hypothetical protein
VVPDSGEGVAEGELTSSPVALLAEEVELTFRHCCPKGTAVVAEALRIVGVSVSALPARLQLPVLGGEAPFVQELAGGLQHLLDGDWLCH